MSVESQSYSRENLEANILASTKQELSSLKKNIFDIKVEKQEEGIEEKREGFGDYLQENGIDKNEFPKASGLGKFLRTFRYYKEIRDITTKKNIPLNYFFGLKMTEGEGDPSAINTVDSGSGISQIQPDTFKQFGKDNLGKDYKVFYDDPRYAAYNYDTLMNSASMKKKYPDIKDRRPAVNQIMADVLMGIKKDGGYTELIALDDRFNPQIALEFSAEYLLYCKKKVDTKTLTDKSRDQYKNDKEFDFEWMLALNGYNKGPARFYKNFEGTHIANLKLRIGQYDLYSQKLTDLLEKGYSYEEVLLNIKKEEKDWKKIEKKNPEDSIPKITTSEKTIEFPSFLTKREEIKSAIPDLDFIFKQPETQAETVFTFLNKSKDKQRNVYKHILPKNIESIMDLNYLYKKLPGKELQFTDSTGEKLTLEQLGNLKTGDILYIKEKI